MRKTLISFLSISLFTATNLFAQHASLPKNIQSPNAASLGQYGDVPVSFYHGTANVNIPIYSTKEQGIPLDISLNYDTSGVRVNSVPGWVGQNWSLNAGGVITRTVQGTLPDETNTSDWQGYAISKGYIYQNSKLNRSDWFSTEVLTHYASHAFADFNDIWYDLEPDIFTFNFMGFSGKFFLSETGDWKVHSESNFNIKIEQSDYIRPLNFQNICDGMHGGNKFNKVIGKITLIDDNGTTYVFGGNHNSIEYSFSDFFNQCNSALIANSWYLTEVVNNLGIKVYSFEYERGDYAAMFYPTFQYTSVNKQSNNYIGNPGGGCGYSYGSDGKYAEGQLLSPVYLNKLIMFSGKSIEFISDNSSSSYYKNSGLLSSRFSSWVNFKNSLEYSWRNDFYKISFWYLNPLENIQGVDYENFTFLLDKLKWRKLQNIVLPTETVTLNYNEDYYTSTERLNLKDIKIGDKKYSFDYDRFHLLPDYLSKAVDHWGYYKETDYIYDFNAHYSSRNPDADKVKIGSLTKITYPTKGYTLFEYEPHTYLKFVNENKGLTSETGIAGGLRIKNITNNNGEGKTYTKQYKYTTTLNSTQSTGILMLKNKYYNSNWQVKTTENVTYTESNFSINSLISMSNTSGSHISYSKVHEILEDGSYTTYDYTNYEDKDFKDIPFVNTISLSHSTFDKYCDKSLLRGKLKQLSIYDNQGGLKQRKTYRFSADQSKKVRAYNWIQFAPCPGVGDGVLLGNAYEIYYFDVNTAKETVETFINGEAIEQETTYDWVNNLDSDTFLRSKKVQTYLKANDQNSKAVSESYEYPFDKQNETYPYGIMTQKRILPIVSTVKKENNQTISTQNVIYGSDDNYTSRIFPQKTQVAYGTSTLEDDIIFDKYDEVGNVLQYHKKDGLYTTIIYGYNKQYPVAKIESETLLDYNGALGNYNSSLSGLPGNKTQEQILQDFSDLRQAFPDAMVTTYTHKLDVGVSSITDPRGRTEHYQYDINNRLQRIVDAEGNTIKEFEYQFKN